MVVRSQAVYDKIIRGLANLWSTDDAERRAAYSVDYTVTNPVWELGFDAFPAALKPGYKVTPFRAEV